MSKDTPQRQKVILASTSPRRRELMKLLGIEFTAMKSPYEEDNALDMPPQELVRFLAEGKATAVLDVVTDGLVIGVDTLVAHEGRVYGKPRDREEALQMLHIFNNTTHEILSGYSVVDASTRQKVSGVAITHVMFKDVATSSLESYAQDAHVLDKAGAYDFEDVGCVFIKQITGDFYNAIGMPLSDIADAVASFGVDVV